MQLTAAVLGSALASSGLWALVGRRADKDDAERKMLVGGYTCTSPTKKWGETAAPDG